MQMTQEMCKINSNNNNICQEEPTHSSETLGKELTHISKSS